MGEHDDENGGGPGISLGTRYYFREKYQGLFLGARLDLWLMEIDWQDEIPNAEPEQGTTGEGPISLLGFTLNKKF